MADETQILARAILDEVHKLDLKIQTVHSDTTHNAAILDKIQQILEGDPRSPGLVTIVDRLVQSEAARQRQIGRIWGAITIIGCGVFVEVVRHLLNYFSG